MNRIRFILCCLGVWGTTAGFTRATLAQLPSESTLPGEAPAPAELPGESELPDGFTTTSTSNVIPPSQPANNVDPPDNPGAIDPPSGNQKPTTPGKQKPLPSESTLPPTDPANAGKPQDQPPGVRPDPAEILKLRQSADAIPWLRLLLHGHTGAVRTLAFTSDSSKLCSAGADKSVLVWGRRRRGNRGLSWQYERAIYWQVQRGNAGRIYAVAEHDNLLAIAGHGAMGGLGEILLVDAQTGELRTALTDAQQGHRQVVIGLAFSPDRRRPGLVSTDRDGRTIYWRPNPATGIWTSKVLQATDRRNYGAETAERLRPYRGTAPVVMADGQNAILPVYVRDPRRPAVVTWKLQRINVQNGTKNFLLGQRSAFHAWNVTSLAMTPDGSRLASADGSAAGKFYIWDLRGQSVTPNRIGHVPLSLAFSGDGQTLAVGTAKQGTATARVQMWNATNVTNLKKRFRDIEVAHHVYACAISANGDYLAYGAGNDVVVQPLRRGLPGGTLQGMVNPPTRVAFSKQGPPYRVAFETNPSGSRAPVRRVFDTRALQLTAPGKRDAAEDWLSANAFAMGWRLEVERQATGAQRFWLTEQGRRRGEIPFTPDFHKAPSAWTWIPDRQGRPLAVAVAASGNSNIYVFRIAARGACRPIRVFRGHAGSVSSLAISADRRYLVSAARDGTLRIWPISTLESGTLHNRWGATFAVQQGQLRATSLRENGPLYFRGMRAGDAVQRLRWAVGMNADGEIEYAEEKDPQRMLRRLEELPWETMVAFDYVRGRMPGRAFQIFPAWQQIVSLTVAENREWAYWAPSGYYDASFEGHRLFGWQVNRGLQMLPDVFLAAQLRRALERPQVMANLLTAGSLEAAFRAARAQVPANPQQALVNAYSQKPEVTIHAPVAEQVVEGSTAKVRVSVTVANGQQLIRPKAFANGVVAVNQRLVREEQYQGGRRLTYEWDAGLPGDREILLKVVAATEAGVPDVKTVRFRRRQLPQRRRARLFVAAAGINQYLDAQLPKLDFAVRNAEQVAVTMQTLGSTLYNTEAFTLADSSVTRPVWRVALQRYADELAKQVRPDDVLLIFLSGHGVRDEATDNYYYITANARYRDIRGQRFGDCLSFADFAVFSDLPCRKLVILDTCHSGALQPLRQRELKSALRAIQDDLIFTMTASEGGQEAIEDRQRRLGLFTSRLLEALRGRADGVKGRKDNVVSFGEVVRYVRQTVVSDSAGTSNQQFPTAGPSELLNVSDFPLTSQP